MIISLYLVIGFDIYMHILNAITTKSGLLVKFGISIDFGC